MVKGKGNLKVKVPVRHLSYGFGVSKRRAAKAYVAGFMSKARKHRKVYSKRGIKKISFKFGDKIKISRKI